MELRRTETAARVTHRLERTKTIAAGQQLKSEVGEEELDAVVPAGKQWTVVLRIQVIETDA
jgi:hypothetical protein